MDEEQASGFRLPASGRREETPPSAAFRPQARSPKPVALLIILGLGGALAGCTGQTKLLESELAQLAQWLPGQYDNVEQTQRNAESGGAREEALALVIVPIYSQGLGEHAFYTQEMAASDPRRVTAQRVIVFDVADDRIVQGTFTLAEPLRWRNAHLDPGLFMGLIPHQDLRPLTGCELVWKRDGDRFKGANESSRCRISSRATGTLVNADMRAELTPDALALSERSYDASGRLVYGNAGEPFDRFVKRGP